MKTAEEVLRPYMPIINNRHRSKTDIRETIIHIMEEYANARLQELSLTDMAEEYIKKELPNAEKPFHYDAEGAVCIRDFVKWARNKLTGK